MTTIDGGGWLHETSHGVIYIHATYRDLQTIGITAEQIAQAAVDAGHPFDSIASVDIDRTVDGKTYVTGFRLLRLREPPVEGKTRFLFDEDGVIIDYIPARV
jgi:hypothetical protein